jgi:hypothetical protein
VREIKPFIDSDLSKMVTVELSLLEVAVIYATFAKESTGKTRQKVKDVLGPEIADYIGLSNGRKDVPHDLYVDSQSILMRYGLLEGRD